MSKHLNKFRNAFSDISQSNLETRKTFAKKNAERCVPSSASSSAEILPSSYTASATVREKDIDANAKELLSHERNEELSLDARRGLSSKHGFATAG
jgi:hypothetical protein